MVAFAKARPGTEVRAEEILIAGPTAVGKSAVALRLAERLPGEIITVDSMQVYRGMDIGTAKPSAEEMARVPHHLVSIVGLEVAFDAATFLARATEAAREVRARGRTPVLCGGTGLYFKAYTEGLGAAPAPDPRMRAELEKTSVADLLEELRAKDPETFGRIDRRNPRRVIRAVEMLRLTGQPIAPQRASWGAGSNPHAGRTFILDRPADDLRVRISGRVEQMFADGLVEETERLLAAGLEGNRNAMQALGYRQVTDLLRGRASREDTVELVKVRTCQFARRQRTWLRRQMTGHRLELRPDETAAETAERVLALLSAAAQAGDSKRAT